MTSDSLALLLLSAASTTAFAPPLARCASISPVFQYQRPAALLPRAGASPVASAAGNLLLVAAAQSKAVIAAAPLYQRLFIPIVFSVAITIWQVLAMMRRRRKKAEQEAAAPKVETVLDFFGTVAKASVALATTAIATSEDATSSASAPKEEEEEAPAAVVEEESAMDEEEAALVSEEEEAEEETDEVIVDDEVEEAAPSSRSAPKAKAKAEKVLTKAEKAAAAQAKADKKIQSMTKWPILGGAVERQLKALEEKSGKKRVRVNRSAKKADAKEELPSLADVIAKQLINNAKNAR